MGELVVTLVLFGCSFPAYKLATDGFGVGTVVAARFAVASAVMVAISRGLPSLPVALWRRLLLIGAVGLGGQALAMTAGIDAGTSTLGALILGLEPIGVAVAAVLVAGERPGRATVAGLGLGLAGVAVVSGLFTAGVSGVEAAVGYLLLTVVLFSLYAVQVRRWSGQVDAAAVAVVTSLGAAAATLPLVVLDAVRGGVLQGDVHASAVAGAAYLGVGTGVAYLLFAHVLSRLDASRFAVAMYAVPTIGVIASWVVLGERPLARDVVGGAMILAAVWVAENRRTVPDVGVELAGVTDASENRAGTEPE
ncbi:MAG TPA: DMT family transporter [Gaiellales bacterium]|jgi:drug/metabolite transporter (DMT)-like permease|nr:DMT family transporter [Gaiellales bacterium]